MFFFDFSLIWFFTASFHFPPSFDFIRQIFFHISLISFFTATFHFLPSFDFIHRAFFHISLTWFLLLLSIFCLPLGVHSSCILSHFTHLVFTATFHFPPSAWSSFIMYSFTFHSFGFYCFFPFSAFRFDFLHRLFFHISLISFLLLLSIFHLPF
ncbi:ALG3 [Acanthosepion pharaonis]|uniref:ALG3 n=1 Tax=Acanthosepion pharaonis TaxID=158019 RepID=A0A812B666_ACAPH|nr:ALG3 [Sepia pharaonis]